MSGSFRLSSSERIEVVRQFQHRFDREPPTRKAILDLVRKFDKTGSVEDVARPSRSRSVSTDENRKRVRVNFQQNSESSTRRAALELNLSRTSLRRMMKELGLKPYRPQLLHALNEDDPDRRCEFADSSFLNRIVWSDEAIFKLNGHVNRHNCIYYAVENPHIVINEEMNAPGITVWAGILSGGIIGPFFFYDNVTADNYLDMLEENIVPAIEKEMNLDETFPDRWIGRRGWIECPVGSPDLTPTDFFLWSVIKDRVYATKPPNLQTLEDAIITEMQNLPVQLCRTVCQSVLERVQLCKDLEGKHIEQFL